MIVIAASDGRSLQHSSSGFWSGSFSRSGKGIYAMSRGGVGGCTRRGSSPFCSGPRTVTQLRLHTTRTPLELLALAARNGM
jgi:hypothetical protein